MPEESVYKQVEKQASSIECMTQMVHRVSQWFEKPTELTEDMRARFHATLLVLDRYLQKVPREDSNVMLEVVGWDETRQIDAPRDSNGNVRYLAPVSGTSRSVIDVRTPEGLIFRIPVEGSILEAICRCQKPTEAVEPLLRHERPQVI